MQWVGTSRGSMFALYPYEFSPSENHYKKVKLTDYCKQRHITKFQVRKLVQKKWLAITYFRGRIWVHEICSDQIDEFLRVL